MKTGLTPLLRQILRDYARRDKCCQQAAYRASLRLAGWGIMRPLKRPSLVLRAHAQYKSLLGGLRLLLRSILRQNPSQVGAARMALRALK